MLLKKPAQQKKTITNIILIIFFFFSLLLWQSSKWIFKIFGYHISVDSILFTLTFPVQGFNAEILSSYPKRFFIAFLPTILYGYLLFKSYQIKRKIFYKTLVSLVFFVFIGSNYYIIKHLELIEYLSKKRTPTSMYEKHYERIEPQDVKFTVKNNVIMIMLESMEETFNDEALFTESLIPNLTKLRDENLSFYGYEQLNGTTWTTSALTSYLFGLPLILPNLHNTFANITSSFLPSASSIITVFEEHGYQVEFFLGSDSNYGGQKNIFTTHLKRPLIYDFFYFQQKKSLEKIGWGLPDYRLFEEIKLHLQNKSTEQPFFLLIQTVDTHAPEGGSFYNQIPTKWNDFRDVIVEADKIVSDFTNWLQKQDFAENTTIILVGDHLAMTSNIGAISIPSTKKREIYNVFINPVPTLNNRKQFRSYGAFDLAPTILESAGGKLPNGKFGIGTSLFQPTHKTLLESDGKDYYEEESGKKSTFYQAFFY